MDSSQESDQIIGECVKTLGGIARVAETEHLTKVATVFNLEVESDHCYYITKSFVLSHNSYTKPVPGGGAIQANEVTTFEDFAKRSVVGDNLEGHEVLQHANLKVCGHAATRLSTEASKQNPVIALERGVHREGNRAQRVINAINQAPLENIRDNMRILREHPDVPNEVLQQLEDMATRHGQNL